MILDDDGNELGDKPTIAHALLVIWVSESGAEVLMNVQGRLPNDAVGGRRMGKLTDWAGYMDDHNLTKPTKPGMWVVGGMFQEWDGDNVEREIVRALDGPARKWRRPSPKEATMFAVGKVTTEIEEWLLSPPKVKP